MENTTMNGLGDTRNGAMNPMMHRGEDRPGEASNVDHALLESLFYNEMMLLDGSAPIASNFLAQHLSDAAAATPSRKAGTSNPADATTMAETALLRDFGVSSFPTSQASCGAAQLDSGTPHPTHATNWGVGSHPPANGNVNLPQPRTDNISMQYVEALPVQAPIQAPYVQPPPAQAPAHAHMNQPPMQPITAPHLQTHYMEPPGVHPISSLASSDSSAELEAEDLELGAISVGDISDLCRMESIEFTNNRRDNEQHQVQHGEKQFRTAPAQSSGYHRQDDYSLSYAPVASTPISNGGQPLSNPVRTPQDPSNKLVSQFTTLASRLGIDLPSSVLQSLTAAAAANGSIGQPRSEFSQPLHPKNSALEGEPTKTSSMLGLAADRAREDGHLAPPSGTVVSASNIVTPMVQELQRTAEEAIAAVAENRKRTADDPPPATINDRPGMSSATRPVYGRRRKKPRLSDCESKLAELQAENELLKRHLANVSNKADVFEQEQAKAGERFKEMVHEERGEQVEKAVREFSDLYSDYGKRRQQELTFHLEQLQRLANPTNFTKMGLWTMAQNSKDPNPIAGILQQELGINPQQGRKILEQREKIRTLCDNLDECLALLTKLKTLCEQKTRLFHDRMNKCREILTSKQTVKLINWISDNTLLLETVCPGWGSEHIHSRKPQGNK